MFHVTAPAAHTNQGACHGKATSHPKCAIQKDFHTDCTTGASQKRSSSAYAWRYPPVATVTCFHPVPAWRSTEVNPSTGKRGLVFSSKHPQRLAEGLSFSVPCGRCIGCRLDRSRDWAVRCMHEAQLHHENCFLTLTFDDKHLPSDFSIQVRTHQLFMKRLRESAGTKLRFFACGEYGEDDPNPFEGHRPHYHYLIFGYRPNDLRLHSKTNNIPLYTSEKIQKLWPYGFSTVGNVTYQTAAYCARYTMKKIGGDKAAAHYTRIHPVTGDVVQVVPEFSKQSNRPGIGDAWYETFKSDIYPSDFCVVDGKRHAVPKFYIKKLAEEERTKVKRKRKIQSNKKRADNTPARLRVRELVQTAQANMLKRNLK